MNDFDTMLAADAPAFLTAFGKETQGTYHPGTQPSYSITVIYDPEIRTVDPLSNEDINLTPMITVATVDLQAEAKQGDDVAFEGMRFEVEHNEGDYVGLTVLRVRRKK